MTNKDFVIDWFENHIWAPCSHQKYVMVVVVLQTRDIPKGTSVYDKCDRSVRVWVDWEDISHFPQGKDQYNVFMIVKLVSELNQIVKTSLGKKEYGKIWMYTTEGLNWIKLVFSKSFRQLISMLKSLEVETLNM